MELKTLITHNGGFHSDDIFAAATLFLLLEKKFRLHVVRTRDEKIVARGNYVFDVGGIYNPKKRRFDHHQKGGAGKRENKISYASFGLVWKEYGEKICGSKKIAEIIDRRLVEPIDATDNGDAIFKPLFKDVYPYTIQDFFFLFNPTWKEKAANIDSIFLKLVLTAKTIISREIVKARHTEDARIIVNSLYRQAKDKRLIVMEHEYPWKDIVSDYKNVLYVIHPDVKNKTWAIRTVRNTAKSFQNRKDLPKSWAGERNHRFQKITGISDALFCHNKRFVAVARSKEGALKLAQIALNS